MASDNALILARESLEHYKTVSNEWRAENLDQRAQYMTSDKVEAMFATERALRSALEARVRVLEQASIESVGKTAGTNMVFAVAATVITLIISAVAVLVRFIK